MVIRLGKVCVKMRGGFSCRAVPHSPNSLNAMHWAKRAAWTDAWKTEVGWRLRENRVKLGQGKAIVAITLYTIKPQDYDNSVASIKAVVDGLKGIGIIDDNQNVLALSVATVKVNKKCDERVEIEL